MCKRTAAAALPSRAGHEEQVRALFDSKAAGWPGKYAAGGPLAGRLSLLTAAARELVVPGGELLDLGCGSGELARELAARGYRVTGCDIAPEMLRAAARAGRGHPVRWLELQPGWRELPFAAGSLDAVVASSVLEYVRDPAGVLAECARVLRPGGALLCTVPSVAHPVRWAEWPLRQAARTPAGAVAGRVAPRLAQYLAYLRASRHRRRLTWWHAAGRLAGLEPSAGHPGGRPLRLLSFTRPAHAAGQRTDTLGAMR
jgi:SAM-dependent methyltransferase